MSLLISDDVMPRTEDPRQFGRVAVLLGGDSVEREISLLSGGAVLAALRRRGVDAHAFDPRERPIGEIATGFDRAWIALHGPGGEDGLMQGALEWLGVPYTGSGVLASALTMDKLKTKLVAAGVGCAVPPFALLEKEADFERALAALGLPMMVKPASQGSSVGITKVKDAADLPRAFAAARAIESLVFAEAFVGGGEYTVALLQDRALPSIRIEPATEFYDYEAKYFRDDTVYRCPSGLDAGEEADLAAAALAAFRATGCQGWGRADFMRDARDGRFTFIEINTTPGMTDHSLVPMAARRAGLDFADLAWQVLETSFARRRK
ncbi:MAG TPA: D-alanine--D-alanine ligase [Steroidobacteraceae bacterium]|nr:D-alanine--D-alanine ligase [Steroidobacteraceae bacterium]